MYLECLIHSRCSLPRYELDCLSIPNRLGFYDGPNFPHSLSCFSPSQYQSDQLTNMIKINT